MILWINESLVGPGDPLLSIPVAPRREEAVDRSDAHSSGLHNVVTLRAVRHVWSGIDVHDIRIKALPGRSWHPLNCDRPVLSIVVNELHGQCEARLDLSARNAPRQSGRQRPVGHISLIPAGVPAWGYSDGIDQVEEVRVVLDVDRMKEIMGEEFTSAPLQEPRLVFNDESLEALARLLVTNEDTAEWSSLFGESLVAAMVARLSNLDPVPRRNHRRLGLSTRQLSAVTDFIRDNIASPIRLSELASLADLSPSQFGRAFKDAPSVAFGCPDRECQAIARRPQQQPSRDRAGYRLFRAKPFYSSLPRRHRHSTRCMAARFDQLIRAPRPRSHSQRETSSLTR